MPVAIMGNASAAAAGLPCTTARERDAFERYVWQLRSDLYRYALWLCGDASVAEDALQEALIRAWRSWDALRDEGAVKSWLCTIVRRECARVFERKRLCTRDIDELTEAEERLIATEDTDMAEAELRRAIAALDETYRQPLILQVLMGYTVTEIASIVGIKPGAVLTRLCRARQKLISGLETA